MITNETVFVLGAGASWHYGYPTGEGLVDQVITNAIRLRDCCYARINSGQVVQEVPIYVEQRCDKSKGNEGALKAWSDVAEECQVLINRLQTVKPLVIDYFLGWNASLRDIGRLMIAASILECEAKDAKGGGNQNRLLAITNSPTKQRADELGRIDITKYKDDWYRFVTHKLVMGCETSGDLFNNKVRFLTFNYDTSLEQHLYASLASIDLFEDAHVRAFLGDGRIIHTYGAVRAGIPKPEDFIDVTTARELGVTLPRDLNFQRDLAPRKRLLDQYLAASKNIRTIGPHEKHDEKILQEAQARIAGAKVLYILGYGFDEQNNERIGLENALSRKKRPHKSVMFTNYRDINTINKRASKLIFGRFDQFLVVGVHGDPKDQFDEKSTRDVYEALELDFDTLESELLARTAI